MRRGEDGRPLRLVQGVLAFVPLSGARAEGSALQRQPADSGPPALDQRGGGGARGAPLPSPIRQQPSGSGRQSPAAVRQRPRARAANGGAVSGKPPTAGRRAGGSRAAEAAAGTRHAKGRAGRRTAAGTRVIKRGSPRLGAGTTLTGISQNLCGLPEQSAWELCSAGYDIVSMQETHGDEQRKSHWPQGQLFVGAQPPPNDPAAGVAIFISKDLSRCVTGAAVLGRRFPARIMMVRVKASPVDIVLVNVYVPHAGRSNPSMQEVLDDVDVTYSKAFGAERVCAVLTSDLNAQLPRNIPRRTGRWCGREHGNAQGQRVLRLMDKLDLYAASTGNSSKPKRRGGECTYSVCERTRVRAEKRVQLDYVMISSMFFGWFLGSYGTWKWCKKRRGDTTDHKGIVYRIRVRLRSDRVNPGRRWDLLRSASPAVQARFSEVYVSTAAKLRGLGAERWRQEGFACLPQAGFDWEKKAGYGERMAHSRQTQPDESATTAEAAGKTGRDATASADPAGQPLQEVAKFSDPDREDKGGFGERMQAARQQGAASPNLPSASARSKAQGDGTERIADVREVSTEAASGAAGEELSALSPLASPFVPTEYATKLPMATPRTSVLTRRSYSFRDYCDPQKLRELQEQNEFDRRVVAARAHSEKVSGRAMHRKGYRVDSTDGIIYRHHGQRPVGAFKLSMPRADYGSGVFLPSPAEIEEGNGERRRLFDTAIKSDTAERRRRAADQRLATELATASAVPLSMGPKDGTIAEDIQPEQGVSRDSDTKVNAAAVRAKAAATADRQWKAEVKTIDVEFEHAVWARAAAYAFDIVNPMPGVDVTIPVGIEPGKSTWFQHVGSMVGDETAAAAAESLVIRREAKFAEIRAAGGEPTREVRAQYGTELGRINLHRERMYFEGVCEHLEDAVKRRDWAAHKKCLARLGKSKVRPNKTADGAYDEHGVFTSFEGDAAMLTESNRDYLKQHFAADEFEPGRPEWPELSTTKEDRLDIGPSRDELMTVWEACSLGRAFGADQIPKEATAASPDCLEDFLRVVGASIFQEDVSSGMMLVMFVLLYKGKGDVNDKSRHRAIGLMTLVLKVWEGWITMTRLKPLLSDCVPATQTAYQSGINGATNVLWVSSTVSQICALGRSAVLPLLDASGAFDSMSWSLLDESLAEGRADDKTRAMIRLMYTMCRGMVRTRGPDGSHTYSTNFELGGGVIQGGKGSPTLWIIGLAHLLRKVDIARFPLSGGGELVPGLHNRRCSECRTIESSVESHRFEDTEECTDGNGVATAEAVCPFCAAAYSVARERGLIPAKGAELPDWDGPVVSNTDWQRLEETYTSPMQDSPGPWASDYVIREPAAGESTSASPLQTDSDVDPTPARRLAKRSAPRSDGDLILSPSPSEANEQLDGGRAEERDAAQDEPATLSESLPIMGSDSDYVGRLGSAEVSDVELDESPATARSVHSVSTVAARSDVSVGSVSTGVVTFKYGAGTARRIAVDRRRRRSLDVQMKDEEDEIEIDGLTPFDPTADVRLPFIGRCTIGGSRTRILIGDSRNAHEGVGQELELRSRQRCSLLYSTYQDSEELAGYAARANETGNDVGYYRFEHGTRAATAFSRSLPKLFYFDDGQRCQYAENVALAAKEAMAAAVAVSPGGDGFGGVLAGHSPFLSPRTPLADDSYSNFDYDEVSNDNADLDEVDDYDGPYCYRPGDNFIKIWDAKAYTAADDGAHKAWVDHYDRAAKLQRELEPYGLDSPMLMRELMPSAEYADDILPLCSDPNAATYRISNMRRGLLRFGGVKLNMLKLKFMLIRRMRSVRITAKQIESYAAKRSDWFSCMYCSRREPSKAGIRQHQESCRSAARDPTVDNPGGPQAGKAWYVKRVVDSAGDADNRFYLVQWSHPCDPSPGQMPGEDGYVDWTPGPADGPGYCASWEHNCCVGKTAKRAIHAYYMTESRPGFGLTQACEDYSINRCYFCNERYRSVSELQEHLKLCDSKPPSRAGTKAHAAAKRNYVNLHSGEDLQPVRLLCASGEEDIAMGGDEFGFLTDHDILGCLQSGDGNHMPAVQARLAIGRAAFNRLYRLFKRRQFPTELKLRFYESFVIGTLHGYQAWLIDGAIQRRINGWNASMLSVITGRTHRQETSRPSIDLVARLTAGQMKMIGGEMRQSDSYPSRIALLRTLLLVRLGIQKKGDTLLGHALTALWDDHVPSARGFIETAGSLFDQSPEAEKRRSVKAGLDAQTKLTETVKQRLVRQRARKREVRNWGDRARQLIGSLPDGGYCLFTDGGSNTNRYETGWGVTVLRKRAAGHPEVVAELFGQVITDWDSEYYVGALMPTNDTAEGTAMYHANLWLHNEGGHAPAVIVADSERALTMADGKSAPLGSLMREMLTGTGGVNVVLTDIVRRMHTRERDRRKGGVLLAHVKGHSGDAGNDRADSLCELGKGNGPYSQQKAFVQGESAEATARRIAEGEGYPHEAVPGEFACAWSTEKQRLATDSDQASAHPPISAKVGTSKVEPRSQLSPDYGSGVRLGLSWKDTVGMREWRALDLKYPNNAARRKQTVPERKQISLERLAGTPSAELYTMNIVAHARTNRQVETVERRSVEDDVAIEAALCDPRWIRDSNKASIAHWEACGEDAGDWAAQAVVHGSPEPFMRATPYLRRNVAGVKRHRGKCGRPPDSGELLIRRGYLKAVGPAALRVVKRERFIAVRDSRMPLQWDFDTKSCVTDTHDDCSGAHDHGIYEGVSATFSDHQLGRSGPYSQLIVKSRLTSRLRRTQESDADLNVWRPTPHNSHRHDPGPGFGGGMHVFYLDLEQYPLTRSRRIYEGASVSGEGGHQADWNVMSEDWGYQHGLEPWQMPNVRLGMRGQPTPADYKRLWNTTAMEFVLRSDTLSVRRRERNRLQKEYERAQNGQPASVKKDGSAGKRKAVPVDLVKAARIKAQLDRWVLDPAESDAVAQAVSRSVGDSSDEIDANSGGTDSGPAAAGHPTGKGDFEAAGRPRGLRSVSSVWPSVSSTTDGSQQQLLNAFGVYASTRGGRIGMQPESAAVFDGHRRQELSERLAEISSAAAHPDNDSQSVPRSGRVYEGSPVHSVRSKSQSPALRAGELTGASPDAAVGDRLVPSQGAVSTSPKHPAKTNDQGSSSATAVTGRDGLGVPPPPVLLSTTTTVTVTTTVTTTAVTTVESRLCNEPGVSSDLGGGGNQHASGGSSSQQQSPSRVPEKS